MNELGAKRLELVSEAVPKDAVLALLVNPNNPNAGPDTKDLQAAAEALGRRLEVLSAGSEREIETAFAAVLSGGSARCLSTSIRSWSAAATNWSRLRRATKCQRSTHFVRW